MNAVVQAEEQAPRPASPFAFTPIRFRTADEFRSRPAWRDKLLHQEHKLHRIIGDYSFNKPDALACGLKDCRIKHQHGYVVETVDLLETHIGRYCGKKFFGVNWGEIQAVFDRATKERDISEWLQDMVQKRDAMMARAYTLYAVLAKRTGELREVLSRIGKEPLVMTALQRIMRAQGAIQVEREIDADTADVRGLRRKERYYLETVGRVVGLEALQPGYEPDDLKGDDLLRTLRTHVIAPLAQLSAGNLKALNARQRKDRVKELETVNTLLAEADKHLNATRSFLALANLRALGKLPIHRPNERATRILHHFANLPE